MVEISSKLFCLAADEKWNEKGKIFSVQKRKSLPEGKEKKIHASNSEWQTANQKGKRRKIKVCWNCSVCNPSSFQRWKSIKLATTKFNYAKFLFSSLSRKKKGEGCQNKPKQICILSGVQFNLLFYLFHSVDFDRISNLSIRGINSSLFFDMRIADGLIKLYPGRSAVWQVTRSWRLKSQMTSPYWRWLFRVVHSAALLPS